MERLDVSLDFLEFPPTHTCDGGPPHGQMIRYLFRVYGLDTMLGLPAGSGKHELVAAMKGHVVQYGETAAVCSR